MLTLLPLALAALAAAQTLSPSIQHAKRTSLPAGWSRVRRHAPDAVLPLRFGLTQPNVDMDTLQELLNDVSHPESPNYGKHWSPERVAHHFAPSDESVNAVVSWISENGFAKDRVQVSKTKGWVRVNATVAETEALLRTEYHVFAHDDTGKEHVACDSYHLPAHIVPHVELVTPSIDFNKMLRKRASVNETLPTQITVGQPGGGPVAPVVSGRISSILHDLANCDTQTTPDCLRALYNFVYAPIAANRNSFAIAEYTPQAYVPTDLDMFAKNFTSIGPSLVGVRPVLNAIDGAVVQNTDHSFYYNSESNLDFQYAMNLVTANQKIQLYQVGDLEMGASFDNMLDAVDGSFCTFEGGDNSDYDGIYPDPLAGGYQGQDCGTIKPANVISVSYAYNEADLSRAFTARQCAEYAKLGLMGVTILYASGDNGVAGNSGLCLTSGGSDAVSGFIFNPSFPGTCPFVTAVGATQVNPGASVTDPESACNGGIVTGGGFSNYFTLPDYQKSAVTEYLTQHKPPYSSDIYNSTGTSRAYPDISANGANYVVAINGEYMFVDGTSASTPVVASMITMINDARIFLGKSPVGFINPTLYSPGFKTAFNDITTGSNPGCGTNGFSAVPGFDPATGLGTPNFAVMLVSWLLLP